VQPNNARKIMETLNKITTKIFMALVEKMQGQQHLKISNEPFMPLTIEQVDEPIATPWGMGAQYSLCHYYEQNGDLLQDPEVCFILIETVDTGAIAKIFPLSFCQANLGIYKDPISFQDGKIFRYDPYYRDEENNVTSILGDNLFCK
jgi:hypothetical protein